MRSQISNFKYQITNHVKIFNKTGHAKLNRGFTLIEILLSAVIFSILIAIVTLNLNTAQSNTSITSSVDTLLADLSQQQIKAMVGDTEGRSVLDNYGIRIGGSDYTLFHGTYSSSETTNFSIVLPVSQQITSTFPSNQIIFTKGSGEISGYNSNQDTITITNTVSNERKIIEFNRYGIITGIN